MTGWLCATGWQCAIVAIAFLAGTIIQGLIVLNNADYVFERWQGTLLVIAITVFSILFNTFLAKRLPLIEVLILILHVVGFLIIIIPLWILSPRDSVTAVFTEFNNGGGWNSNGTATLVGFSTTITALVGYDCVVHMCLSLSSHRHLKIRRLIVVYLAEEIEDASETLPKAMLTAVTVNSIMGFVMLITICFTLGDTNNILASATGYPFIQVFYNSTGSLSATNALTSILIMTLIASTITEVATASRQLWSFARDRGLPFSDFFSDVSPRNTLLPLQR